MLVVYLRHEIFAEGCTDIRTSISENSMLQGAKLESWANQSPWRLKASYARYRVSGFGIFPDGFLSCFALLFPSLTFQNGKVYSLLFGLRCNSFWNLCLLLVIVQVVSVKSYLYVWELTLDFRVFINTGTLNILRISDIGLNAIFHCDMAIILRGSVVKYCGLNKKWPKVYIF